MITGAGLPRFNDAVLALHTIESVFSQVFREDQLETYQSSIHHNYPSIEASNRYFSTCKDIPSNDFLHLPTTIDPRGYLKEPQYQDSYTQLIMLLSIIRLKGHRQYNCVNALDD